jgi:hypothetical protein
MNERHVIRLVSLWSGVALLPIWFQTRDFWKSVALTFGLWFLSLITCGLWIDGMGRLDANGKVLFTVLLVGVAMAFGYTLGRA